VIAGARGVNKLPDGCWYELIHGALTPDAAEEPAEDGQGTVWRWRKAAAETIAGATVRAGEAVRHDVPDWLRHDAPAEAFSRAISPSAAFATGTAGDPRALARGRIVHRLLQALPALPKERRAEAALRHVGRMQDLNAADRDTIAREVLALLDDERFADLFAAGSRAEVPVAGILDGKRISGQVDRLAVTTTEVLIADYKSDRFVPRMIGDIPHEYIGQLALYRGALRLLYPNHSVRAALIWTAGPALTELPETVLDAALSSRKPR
jgi:ATP-dependent helicase/nuclease subunit A